MIVDLRDQFRSRLQRRRRALQHLDRAHAGRPAADPESREKPDAFRSRDSAIRATMPARIREHQRMMHDAAVRRPELDGADKPVARKIHRHDEALVDILTFRRYIERLAELHHQIRLAQLPVGRELRRRRQFRRISFARAGCRPSLNGLDLSFR